MDIHTNEWMYIGLAVLGRLEGINVKTYMN